MEKEIAKLEEQKAAFQAAQAEEAKKAELESVLKQLMDNGMSVGGDSGAAAVIMKLCGQASARFA